MSIYSIIKGAALGSLLAVPSIARAEVAADPNCWRAEEMDAARFEDFRLRLLVGALNCRTNLPAVTESYNQFAETKKDVVLANMNVVTAHFVREAGLADGADQFANYETLAGNRYSSPTFDHAKCESVDTYLKLATTLPDAELVKMVAVLSPGPLPSGCKSAARPVAVAAVVPVTAAVVAAAPPAPSAAVVAAVPAPVTAPATATAAPPAFVPPVLTTAPMTDAERVAASTAATRALIASRASLTRPVATPAQKSAEAPVAAAPAAQPASVVPATLLAAAQPVAASKPVAEPAPAPAAAAVPFGAAQALADAAKALAAAAAAMQPGAH